MNVLGIIAEYNPFHNGHLYHLKESKRITNADYTVCIMSGNFTQRGEPAMVHKWYRAKMAIDNGIDLVIELPFVFACNNAEYFSKGAIDLLNNLGCITHLSFGSEVGDLKQLNDTAEHLTFESDQFQQYIKEFLNQGMSYPKARYEAIKEYAGEKCSDVIKDANNILAVEYLKQLMITKSNINPITIKRYGTGYHDKSFYENIASATAIRERIKISKELIEIYEYIPQKTVDVLMNIDTKLYTSLEDFYKLIYYKILISDSKNLTNILSATEGLENRIKKVIHESKNMESMIKAIISKRYTITRIQRLLIHILMELDKNTFNSILIDKVNYGRILALNKKGALLLKYMKKNKLNSIPLITNINREIDKDSKVWKLLSYDIKATDIYNLVTYGEINNCSDYVMKPYKDFV